MSTTTPSVESHTGIATASSTHPALSPSQSHAVSSLSALLLLRPLRITTLDNRSFIGTFVCLDPQCNIILANAEEFLPDPVTEEDREVRENREMYFPKSQRGPGEGEGWGGRQVGMILVPGKELRTVEAEERWGGELAGGCRNGMQGEEAGEMS